MENKSFLSTIKAAMKRHDKNSVAIGVVAGVAVMLGINVLMPDTTNEFSKEIRGKARRRHHRHHPDMPASETPPEAVQSVSFTAKEDVRKAAVEPETVRSK